MYEISVKAEFSAAHRLREYHGKCEDLHGHNWKVEVILQRQDVNRLGMAIDFHEVKNRLNETLSRLDHNFLNDIPYFKQVNPTSENIAKYIFDELKLNLKGQDINIVRVTVWESDTSAASYTE